MTKDTEFEEEKDIECSFDSLKENWEKQEIINNQLYKLGREERDIINGLKEEIKDYVPDAVCINIFNDGKLRCYITTNQLDFSKIGMLKKQFKLKDIKVKSLEPYYFWGTSAMMRLELIL